MFVVTVNRNNDILVEGETFMTIDKIREEAAKFIDNGGGLGNPIDGAEPAECDWCEGAKDPASSDHPNKAIISLESDRGTSYGTYISVQNELVGAYNVLRNRRALEIGPQKGFRDMNFIEMQKNYKDVNWPGNKKKLEEVIDQIKKEYPQKLSEVLE